jgi:hypothetical protein
MKNTMKNFSLSAGLLAVAQTLLNSCGVGNDSGQLTEDKGPVTIVYETHLATVTNPYENNGVHITVDGAKVEIHSEIRNEITYTLSGSTADGALKIYSNANLELKMNGISLRNPRDPALNIQTGKKTRLTLVDGTSNNLTGGATFESENSNEDAKAALFSEGQLLFDGNGNLNITAPYRHALCSDDHIRIDGGNLTIQQAEKDGIHANDFIEINGGTLHITSTGDGIDSEGHITVNGGALHITTTGRKSHGLKSAAATTIHTPETIEIQVKGAASKAINSGADLLLTSPGVVRLETSGDAFFDAEESNITSSAGIKCTGNFLYNGNQLHIHTSGSGGKGINAGGNIDLKTGEITIATTGETYRHGEDDSAAKAIKCAGNATLDNCTLRITTSGRKAEGLDCEANLTIHPGSNIEIEARDDALKATQSITVNGGTLHLHSKTKRGLYSKGPLTISGGTITAIAVSGSDSGLECDDIFKITHGTLLAIGNEMTLPTSNLCTQRSLLYTSDRTFTQLSQLEIKTTTEEKNILTIQLPAPYTGIKLLYSSPELKTATLYTLTTEGNLLSTFTLTSMVTTITSQETPGAPPT